MLLIAYGTRPEWLKVKPIIEELKRKNFKYKTLFTGQHKDIVEHSDKPTYQFELPYIIQTKNGLGETITISGNRLNNVLATCVQETSNIFTISYDVSKKEVIKNDITHVLVQGDTTSALGVALAAYNEGLKIIHLEAGLRTHDLENPFPEEANRQL